MKHLILILICLAVVGCNQSQSGYVVIENNEEPIKASADPMLRIYDSTEYDAEDYVQIYSEGGVKYVNDYESQNDVYYLFPNSMLVRVEVSEEGQEFECLQEGRQALIHMEKDLTENATKVQDKVIIKAGESAKLCSTGDPFKMGVIFTDGSKRIITTEVINEGDNSNPTN